MSKKYFGTDGVRGRVGETPITPEFVMHLGYAAGKVLAARDHRTESEHPAVLIGKDTRISGYMLESALQAGLSAAGVDIFLAGPLPTPAIAYLTRALRLQAGIVISASHNPFEDNGIKFFSGDGMKLSDTTEKEIEERLNDPIDCMPSAQLGKARRINDAQGRYIEFCKSAFPNELDLRGLKIVVDCAHGAAYAVAPHVFHELGAEVVAVGNQPDGININRSCGATYPQFLQEMVRQHHADLGIAVDGDGDRVIMVDGEGAIYDGDQLIYIIAKQRQKDGALKGGVAGTLMTNFGMEQALNKLNIPFERANVGDRYVFEVLQNHGWQLGGENSGHIICLDKHTTGDGIISALQVLHAIRVNKATLAELTRELKQYAQVLVNVKVRKGFNFENNTAIQSAVKATQSEMNGDGRILLRASGTEPVIRVMVEGTVSEKVKNWADKIAQAVQQASS